VVLQAVAFRIHVLTVKVVRQSANPVSLKVHILLLAACPISLWALMVSVMLLLLLLMLQRLHGVFSKMQLSPAAAPEV
jgi:hypothetical protein